MTLPPRQKTKVLHQPKQIYPYQLPKQRYAFHQRKGERFVPRSSARVERQPTVIGQGAGWAEPQLVRTVWITEMGKMKTVKTFGQIGGVCVVI